MTDEKRLRTMIRLARFENGKGGRDLRIRRFLLRDYLILSLVRTFILTTIGFIGLLILIVMGNMTFLMDHIVGVDIRALILFILMAYIGLNVFYMAVSLIRAYRQYKAAGDNVRRYRKDLERLDKSLRRIGT